MKHELGMTKEQKIVPLVVDTYLAVIRNSVESHIFRNVYATVGEKKTDIAQDGSFSCAFYVSSILMMFQLIQAVHVTFDSTVQDLQSFGWKRIKKSKIGSIIVWENIDFGKTGVHKHIGFYVGDGKAISNSDKQRCPVEHDWIFNGERQVECILWNPAKLRRGASPALESGIMKACEKTQNSKGN
ncbi:MAG: hypothetical protein V1652_04130 [bacterium]